jgi:hypothetical protein
MDSGVKLKLALDLGENPYIVADRFLEQNDLPAEFKEQVRGAWLAVAAAVTCIIVTAGLCQGCLSARAAPHSLPYIMHGSGLPCQPWSSRSG